MTDPTDDPTDDVTTAAEDRLRAIVRDALDREAEESFTGAIRVDLDRATTSVLAALADELPDGFDALLEHAHRHTGSDR